MSNKKKKAYNKMVEQITTANDSVDEGKTWYELQKDAENRKFQFAKKIFVFGSNLAGRHGAGSAKRAVENYGAKYGCGLGIQGNAYGIPTKDENLNVLSLEFISTYVKEFIKYAAGHPNLDFHVVNIGCGLAGYKPEQIAPLFKDCSKNVILSKEFSDIINTLDDSTKKEQCSKSE